jgi:hypothetical protein
VVDASPQALQDYEKNPTANKLDDKYWFTEGITYSAVTSSGTGFRYYPAIGGFDKGGATLCYVQHLYYILALLNTSIAFEVFDFLNPTLNIQVKDIKTLPVLIDSNNENQIEQLSKECVTISKSDWDSFETSWDFQHHPLIGGES